MLRGYDNRKSVTWFFIPNEKKSENMCHEIESIVINMAVAFFLVGERFFVRNNSKSQPLSCEVDSKEKDAVFLRKMSINPFMWVGLS